MEPMHNSLPKEEHVKELGRDGSALPRRRGLTLETLNRLSPSIITLESLMSEWPPNTYDSGYAPSPMSSGDRFTFPRDDAHGSSDEEYFGCTPEADFPESVHRSSLRLPGSNTFFSPKVAHMSHVEGNDIRAVTPPIKIPTGKPMASQDVDADVSRTGMACSKLGSNNAYGVLDFSELQFERFNENNFANDKEQNCSPSTRFVRPRTYSCPETSRSTPSRPPVPLFPSNISPVTPDVFKRQNPIHCEGRGYLPKALTDPCTGKIQQYLSENPKTAFEPIQFAQHSLQRNIADGEDALLDHDMAYGSSDKDYGLPKGYVHTRFWSTPATTTSNSRPLLIPPSPVTIKPSGSRDAIVDLSHEGQGHRRRVLVLSLPDVVVETSPSFRYGVDVTGDSTPLSHTRENSSCSRDALGPLRHPVETSPVLLRPKRSTGRAYARPRALSCDVTLEETVGRTLRHLADNFQSSRSQQGRPESNSLFGRMRRSVRRSFSRILNAGVESDQDQPQQNAVCDDVFQENLFYFPYDDLDDDDYGESVDERSKLSRENRNCARRTSGDCKKCGGEYKCVRHRSHSSALCKLRLVETEKDGQHTYCFEDHEDETDDFEYYL